MPWDAETLPHQRADGRLHLVMGRRGLSRLHHRAPLRALFPDGERHAAPEVALANVAGGLAGGDAVTTEVALEPGARATLTGAAAEKVYRSLGAATRVTARLTLGEGAALEWLPQETILFDGARLDRRMEVALAPGARLLATEMLVFGRVARGERFATGFLRDAWRVRGPGGLIWADALRLDDPAGQLAARFGLAGA
ncbi:MAG: urease accessory protein UreD, partial [Acetobacteraceae bacterium]|nr:urease accessory protein UreD [Acetobacteraceae bacterium]